MLLGFRFPTREALSKKSFSLSRLPPSTQQKHSLRVLCFSVNLNPSDYTWKTNNRDKETFLRVSVLALRDISPAPLLIVAKTKKKQKKNTLSLVCTFSSPCVERLFRCLCVLGLGFCLFTNTSKKKSLSISLLFSLSLSLSLSSVCVCVCVFSVPLPSLSLSIFLLILPRMIFNGIIAGQSPHRQTDRTTDAQPIRPTRSWQLL